MVGKKKKKWLVDKSQESVEERERERERGAGTEQGRRAFADSEGAIEERALCHQRQRCWNSGGGGGGTGWRVYVDSLCIIMAWL